ncbi:hypothetical protein [Candidatus Solirubrobacter pratensis]|uniref:hypothetical protein n=1 Tax=Candidatus Solirubrobacter pratensis TaxID=1298857 RepID=UPI001E515069|nr:hypothetical protein [Candidatus Solirubrobacter pratensis]
MSGLAGGANSVEAIEQNTRLMRAMRAQRRASSVQRTSSFSSGGNDVFAAIPRFYDPIEYWDVTGLPWNTADESHRHKLHKWLRLYYATHHLVPILIDIFTRFPLVGMEMYCKDQQLADWYSELFLDQLEYQNFFVNLGREYWTVGEAFPMASFDENLGIFEREELINPEDVVIENFPLLGTRSLKIVPPDYLKKLAQSKTPPKEYRQLELNFPELIPYLKRGDHIPISDVLLKQVANKTSPWDDHGTPILLRGLRTLIHEEKLLASQDAIAERLYSPLILAKLGIVDLGDGYPPYIPGPEELDAFRDDLDIALTSDFRLLVHHVGIEMENVFGREQMPRLGDDFDRVERRLMQIFGVNPSLLSAGSNSQPYASSALQAEFLNQILRTYQGFLKDHFRSRAMVVAEAQGHYEYETRGQTRVPVMEEVVEHDAEGKKVIVERHKLLIPELRFQTLDLRDEATERQFLQTLRTMGVPISDKSMLIGVDFDIEDEINDYNEELVKKTVAQQEAKMKTYKVLHEKNLPIPPDLKAEVETVLQGSMPIAPGTPGPGAPGGMPMAGPPMGPDAGGPPMPGGTPGDSIVMPPPPGGMLGPGGFGDSVPGGGPAITAPGPQGGPGGGLVAPAISMERRPGIGGPTSSVKAEVTHDAAENEGTALRPRVASAEKTVERLPRPVKKQSYSIIEPDYKASDSDPDKPA